jgi:hypothetical protein
MLGPSIRRCIARALGRRALRIRAHPSAMSGPLHSFRRAPVDSATLTCGPRRPYGADGHA